MKRKITFLITAAVMLLTMMASTGIALADNASYVFNTDAGIAALGITKPNPSAGTSLSTTSPYVVGQISMAVTHGSTDTRIWNSSGTLDLRIYKNGGSLTFSAATGYNITGITITGSATNVFNVNVGSYSSGSWSNSTTGASSVTFTATGSGKINTITVTYASTGGGSTVATPNISGETPFLNSTEVTITCTTDEASIQYSLDDGTTWTNYSTAFSLNETTTVKAKATKSGMTDSDVATKTFTKVTPYTNIAALTANTEAGTYYVTLSNAVVTYVNGNYAYVQDVSGAVLYYKSGHGLTAGDVLTGTATVTYQLSNNNPRITNLQGITPVSGTPPEPTSLAQSAWNHTFNAVLSQYFQITGATLTKTGSYYYIALGDDNVQLYKNGGSISTLDLSKTYTVVGFPMLYNSTKEILVFENPQVEVSTDPTITVDPVALSNFTYEEGNGPSTVKTISVSGSNLTADIGLSLGDNSDYEMSTTEGSGYTNSLTLTRTGGTVNATTVYVRLKADLAVSASYSGTITLTSTDATPVTVSLSGSVTAPEAPHVTWNLSIASYDEIIDPDIVTWSSSYATMTNSSKSGGTSASNYLGGDSNNRTSSRFYSGNTLTLAPVLGYSITSVVFTATSESYATALQGSTWTNATASKEGTTVTVTPTNGNDAMVAAIGGTCGFTEVKVYYEEYTSAPVWSALPTPTIVANSNYELTLSDFVTAVPAPTITMTTSVSSNYYEYENGEFMFSSTDAGSYEFTFTATNTAGSADATLIITVEASYTILFSVNGEEFAAAEMILSQGSALGTLPVPTENIPAGFTFAGWMVSPDHPYYNANAAPTLVNASTVPTDDMMLDAVFCVSETSQGSWTLSNTEPANNEEVILVAFDGDKYYAMNGPTGIECTVSGDVITGNVPNAVFTAVVEENNYLTQGNNYLHFNSTALKLATGTTNGAITYTAKDGGFTLYANGRYMTHNSSTHNFGVSAQNFGDDDDAATMYIFKYVSGSTNYSDYTTSVVNHADGSYIAENASETLYGIHYINGEVGALYDVTNSGKLIVKNGGILDLSIAEITNTNAANLIIEDGAQMKCNSPFIGTIEKSITGYENYTGTGNGGYYLIASPVSASVNSTLVPTNSNDDYQFGDMDFYWFDGQAVGLEWQNPKYDYGNGIIINALQTMAPKKGFLYARKETGVISISADNNNKFPATGTGIVADNLSNVSTTAFGKHNLIGNPYTCNAFVGRAYYRMNPAGDDFTAAAASEPIKPLEGVFIVFGETETATEVTFTTTAPTPDGSNGNGNLNINASQVIATRGNSNDVLIDRAIVHFGEGQMLPKFMLNPDNTKLYIPQGNKDYAVVRSEARGEMPVNFKAAENGTYTIDVEAENLEVNYLHLIDNLTGMDVDLLATPSYTFEARKSDIASRFRLVFDANTGNDETNDNFAFINNGELIVNGNGTVQVIDILGRQMFSHEVNSAFRIQNSSFAPGVYVLRLVNGNDVKTQKIVIK